MTTRPFVRKSRTHGFWYVHLNGRYPQPDYHTSQAEAFRQAERFARRENAWH